MCGRFTLATPTEVLAGLFEVDSTPLPELPPRYNIAPTQPVAVIRSAGAGGGRELVVARWGLVPGWAKDPSIGSRLINARAETAASKPAFRGAFRHRRCVLPADGFYEWRAGPGGKQPYYFRAPSGRPLALAGLWELWRDPQGQALESCTILTTDANGTVGAVHGRMPALLAGEALDAWLDPGDPGPADLEALLRPSPDDWLVGYGVSRRVNSPAADDSSLVEPVSS